MRVPVLRSSVLVAVCLVAAGGAPVLGADVAASQAPSSVPSPVPVAVTNTQRPLTLDELLAVLDDSATTGKPITVTADVTVRRDIAIGVPVCPPRVARTNGCVFGFLDVRPAEGPVIPVLATTPVASLFADGDEPDGELAFEVGDSQLRLLGRVEQPAGTYSVPVTAAAMTTADALPLGALIAVDGWLGLLGWRLPCPAPATWLTGPAMDSPFVRCPGGWITPTADVPLTTPGSVPMQPDGFAIPVQASAYEAYAPDPASMDTSSPAPRHAVYLLEHVADPEPSVDPRTGWLVVGRLDPYPPGPLSVGHGIVSVPPFTYWLRPPQASLARFLPPESVTNQNSPWYSPVQATPPGGVSVYSRHWPSERG